jgi:hypothetical protein
MEFFAYIYVCMNVCMYAGGVAHGLFSFLFELQSQFEGSSSLARHRLVRIPFRFILLLLHSV